METDMDLARTEAELVASQLSVGQTIYTTCPDCKGRGKFSVSRTPTGVLWNCFRDSCPVKGHSVTSYALLPPARKDSNPYKLKPWTQPTLPCTSEQIEWFEDRFGILAPHWLRATTDGRFLLPVFTPLEMERGYVARYPWGETPWCCTYSGPKTILYMHSKGPAMSWYPNYSDTVVLVEDMVSAYKVQKGGLSGCALLGTQLDNDKVREIGQEGAKQVIIALDNDATETAFKLARKWGLAFNKTRVVPLERDLKEEDPADIKGILGVS